MKDVIERNGVRDAALLERILRFIAANIGSIVSTKKISDYHWSLFLRHLVIEKLHSGYFG